MQATRPGHYPTQEMPSLTVAIVESFLGIAVIIIPMAYMVVQIFRDDTRNRNAKK